MGDREQAQRQSIADMVEAWKRLRTLGLTDKEIAAAIAPGVKYRSEPPEGGRVVPLRRRRDVTPVVEPEVPTVRSPVVLERRR